MKICKNEHKKQIQKINLQIQKINLQTQKINLQIQKIKPTNSK